MKTFEISLGRYPEFIRSCRRAFSINRQQACSECYVVASV